MKQLTIFLFLSCFLLSCSKDSDPCENVNCFNGGFCKDGNCQCPPGWFGKNCETKVDPCNNITCLNGGTCINGICNCPPGFGGSDCGTILTPKSIVLKRITLVKWPTTETNGSGWDLFSGPDLFVKLTKTGNSNVLLSTDHATDVTPGNSQFWIQNLSLTEVNSFYTIQILDWDFPDADDIMDNINFKLFNGTSFPSTISVTNATSIVNLEIAYNF